jgi:pimeloyl-ACP methyl ester carboxylesterase
VTRPAADGRAGGVGQDLVDFADAIGLARFAVAGYDWGGRAACIAAALHPDRVRAAVLIGGYSIQDTLAPPRPAAPAAEQALWYQWYFNTERGRAGLAANRRALCRLLWQTWSPTWRFTDETFNRTAASFDNPDFVEVVIHSYRHRNLERAWRATACRRRAPTRWTPGDRRRPSSSMAGTMASRGGARFTRGSDG